MRVTGSGGVGIEVFVDGPEDGEPVLLMHGWPDSHELWRHQVAALTAAGYRTYAPDLRGFGASDKPTDVDAYGLVHTVGDMLALLDAVGLQSTNVVAHDWGAAAAWGLAAFVPDRVRRFAALSVGHPEAFRAAGFEQRMRSWYMLLFNFDIAERWWAKFGPTMLSSHPDRDAVLAALDQPGALTASFGWYRANAAPRTFLEESAPIPAVSVPVMGIWSTRDVALTEAQMTGSAEHVTGEWRYERLEGAAHWMTLEQPDALNALLLDWLGAATA